MNGSCGLVQAAGALGQPSGSLVTTNIFLQNSLHIAMEARGPAVDVFNIGGGRCQKSR
jgi:hypothetical protein